MKTLKEIFLEQSDITALVKKYPFLEWPCITQRGPVEIRPNHDFPTEKKEYSFQRILCRSCGAEKK